MGLTIENLRDAGCSEEFIREYLLLHEVDGKERFRLLANHRSEMLKTIHRGQMQLDCLDYLIYKLRTEEESI